MDTERDDKFKLVGLCPTLSTGQEGKTLGLFDMKDQQVVFVKLRDLIGIFQPIKTRSKT